MSDKAPTPAPDSAEVDAGEAVTVDVLANDSDPDGDPLTLTSVTAPRGGTPVIVDGAIVYTADPDFAGTDTFSYEACDPAGFCASTTVTITVAAPANRAAGHRRPGRDAGRPAGGRVRARQRQRPRR